MEKTPNAEQRAVINDLDNNLILFASAGTGKTFTVANRVSHILQSGRAKAEEILCLTFTIKACGEMKEDVQSYVGAHSKGVEIRTIHGFCYQLMKEEDRRENARFCDATVCDDADEEELLRSILSSQYLLWEKGKENAESLQKIMGIVVEEADGEPSVTFPIYTKNNAMRTLVSELKHCREACKFYTGNEEADYQKAFAYLRAKEPKKYENCFGYYARFAGRRTDVAFEEAMERHAGKLVAKYNDYLRQSNQADYDDLMVFASNYLDKPDVRARWQKRYKYIIVDEMQDTSALEYSVLKRIFGTNNVMMCGDFFQSIYEWRGSKPETVLGDFMRAYKAKTYMLSENYRSTKLLAEAGFGYLKNTYPDFMGKYCPADIRIKSAEAGEKIICMGFDNRREEAYQVFNYLKKHPPKEPTDIYEWRGSKPETVLGDFMRAYKAKTYMLSENYRSTKLLAEAGFGYLKNTYPDFMGKYCPADIRIKSAEAGEKIICMGFDNRREEAYQVFNYLKKHPPKEPTDICIMARTNKYIGALCEEFEKCNEKLPQAERVRFFSVEENCQFYKKAVVKDVLAVLKLLLNDTDRISMERIAQKYVKQVGNKTIENLRRLNEIGVSIASFADENLYTHGDPYAPLLEGFQTGNIVVYDTETTGLDLGNDQIVQISAIRMDTDGNILATFDQMIEPTVPIGQGAYETHGFDLEYIRSHGGVSAKEGLEKFSAFVRGGVLVGHNSFRFDKPLIRRQLLENGLPELETAGEYDTLVIAKQFLAELPDFKLSTLCEKYGIVNEAAHNALGDITATGKVLHRLIRENILPTALERRNVLGKLQPKFEKLHAFISELKEKIASNDVTDIFEQIIEKMLMRKKYVTQSDVKAMDDLAVCLQNEKIENAESFFRQYLADAALSGSQMDTLIAKLHRIPVITVHQAKGCEFDTVILVGADDNNFPTSGAREGGTEEEEKRVFYVAISRAKKKLIMTKAAYNGRYELAPSPYVSKIPQECLSIGGSWNG